MAGAVTDHKRMMSRRHEKHPMQLFPATMEIKNFFGALKMLENNDGTVVLGQATIKAQTNFREHFDKPHPRLHLEIALTRDTDKSKISLEMTIVKVENNVPCVRYCVNTYIVNHSRLGGGYRTKWEGGVYFGEDSKLKTLMSGPFAMWVWQVDPATKNLTNLIGRPIGNLIDFVDKGSLIINLELLVMTSENVVGRLMADNVEYVTDDNASWPMYVELAPNRYRSPLEMLYKEHGNFDLSIYASDCKAFFLCHRKVLLDFSHFLRNKFESNEQPGNPIANILLENVSTHSLRVILYYLYTKRIQPDWLNICLDLLGSCVNLEIPTMTSALVQDLKDYGADRMTMNAVWWFVQCYRHLGAETAKREHVKRHQLLHPLVPCGEACRD